MNKLQILTQDKNLNTDEAIAWLAEHGIVTNRGGLDTLRREGLLKWIETRGKFKVLYRREDLADAFITEQHTCPSSLEENPARPTGTSAGLSQGSTLTAALKLVTEKRQKRSASGRRRKSSNVLPLERKQQQPLRKPQ
ncbi:hypothetical protein [Leisingera daeponensis]|uniref:hypothetical protein n=1 Tax=Leisingera daeponensis TaxID=405746 RepID=UPI0021BD1D76|nr:hypothetical protein [Leisingera daeponensis]